MSYDKNENAAGWVFKCDSCQAEQIARTPKLSDAVDAAREFGWRFVKTENKDKPLDVCPECSKKFCAPRT